MDGWKAVKERSAITIRIKLPLAMAWTLRLIILLKDTGGLYHICGLMNSIFQVRPDLCSGPLPLFPYDVLESGKARRSDHEERDGDQDAFHIKDHRA